MFKRFLKDNSGATMLEYAILAGLISVASIVIITTVGTDVSGVFGVVDTKLAAVPGV
jgi:pilus assembly protein Flp/PilA